jgi:hypothetical protein
VALFQRQLRTARQWGAALLSAHLAIGCLSDTSDQREPGAEQPLDKPGDTLTHPAANGSEPVTLDTPWQPPQSALDLFGGQTGSEALEGNESIGPCDVLSEQWEPDAGSALGFSAVDIAERLVGRWWIEFESEAAQAAELSLSELSVAQAHRVLRGEECLTFLAFDAQAELQLLDSGQSVLFDLHVRAQSLAKFGALASSTVAVLGIHPEAGEIVQWVVQHEAGVTGGWLQLVSDEVRSQRQSSAKLSRP